MDIAYLYALQNFRETVGGFLTPIMDLITKLAVSSVLLALAALLYWMIDKRGGSLMLLSYGLSSFVNQTIKLCVCAYRPWIRDSRIIPAGDAIVTATGYSFPSGHTQNAMSYYGSATILTWKKRRWVAVIFIALILLTGFSRNFLGVHTPQDVVVAILETR